jgi:uncharacterized protein (DUF1330 family)
MLKSALLLTIGVGLGASAIQGLHAQTKTHYQIALIDIKDEAGYKAAVGEVRKHIEAAGGKFIVTAGIGGYAMGGITSPVAGAKLPSRIVISEWTKEPTISDADTKELEKHATLQIYNVEGLAK